MHPDAVERKLAAIMFTDIVGYTALMAESEEKGLRVRERHRAVVRPLVERYHGEWIESPGDQSLSTFPTALDAVNCGLAIHEALRDDPDLKLHIGIHSGDIVVQGGEISGDGVNIAARLCPLSKGGELCVSGEVYQSVRNQPNIEATPLGEHELKNVGRPVAVFALTGSASAPRPISAAPKGRRLQTVAAVTASMILLLPLGIWLSWPRPLGLLIDVIGVSGPPVNPALPEKPSIAVLPFTNMSGDREQEYFSDGITEDLTTDLAGNPFLFVIARNSAFAYKGKSVQVEDVGRELGVRYVLEGSVRRAEDRVRITAQLIDAQTGFHIWSKRYDRDLADIFALQSEISLEILAAVGVEIPQAELERIRRKPTEDLTAYDLFSKGVFHFNRTTREDNAHARRLFEQAIELDPDYALAHAMLGATYTLEYGFGWNLDPKLLDHAEERVQRALTLNPVSPIAYTGLGTVHFWRDEPAAAVAAADRAIELGPSYAAPHFIRGASLIQQGKFVGAAQSINRALRLNPRASPGQWLTVPYLNLMAGRTQEAVEMFEQARAVNPDLILARIPLAAIYESEGRHEEARAVVQEILRVNPNFTADHAAHLYAGAATPERIKALRSAGLP